MTMHSEAEEIPASPLVSRVGWQVRTFLITESSRRRIVDAGRGAGGEQPRGRGERVIALALRFIVAVGAAALLGQHVVAAVDDQRGVAALQRVRVALLVQVTVASACRNSAGVAGSVPSAPMSEPLLSAGPSAAASHALARADHRFFAVIFERFRR
jgi:hypothetical protein